MLLLALALLLAAGATWAKTNNGLQGYASTTAEVVTVTGGNPNSVTVQFETPDGLEVEATTDRLTFVPVEGGTAPIRYDPSDPQQVVMDGYSETSFVTTALVGLFAVALAGAWFTFRRKPAD